MLTTRSRLWSLSVLQLGVRSGLKSFCDNRYCQNLCDQLYRGVRRDPYMDQSELAVLPKWLGSDLRGVLMLLAHAFVPLPLPSRGFWLVEKRGIHIPGGLLWHDFYNVPMVKQFLRLALSVCYIFLFSYCVLSIPVHLDPPSEAPQLARRLLRGAGGGGSDDEGEEPTSLHLDELMLGDDGPQALGPSELLVVLWTISICLDEW